MAENLERPAYWAVIPADVRYDDDLPANAKLLYGEITALCNSEGYCWASNEYFAQLFGWATKSVTRLVSALRDAGHIEVEMAPCGGGTERRIYAGVAVGGVRKIAEGVSAKLRRGSPQNCGVYNMLNNTQNNTPLTPQGGKRGKGAAKDGPEWKPDRFAGFWDFYPREGKKNKQGAIRAWDRLKPSDDLIREIGQALVKLKATDDWQRGVAIPYAATFLNNGRWHDADYLERGCPRGEPGVLGNNAPTMDYDWGDDEWPT